MTILQIPVPKAKASITINTDDLHDDMFTYALFLGLKSILGRGMTDVKRENFATSDAYEAEALRIANTKKDELLANETRMVGLKAGKTSGKNTPLMAEMMRLAKIHAKSQAKATGLKLSSYSAAEWTRAAKVYIDADPDFWKATATDSLARTSVTPTVGVDFVPQADPDLVAKNEAAKARKRAETAAKAAGKTATKAKVPPKARVKAKAKAQAEA
jgi:hypothetical protein